MILFAGAFVFIFTMPEKFQNQHDNDEKKRFSMAQKKKMKRTKKKTEKKTN